MVELAVVVSSAFLALGVLTGVGQRLRGSGRWLVVTASVFWPVTWVAWYFRDELVASHRAG